MLKKVIKRESVSNGESERERQRERQRERERERLDRQKKLSFNQIKKRSLHILFVILLHVNYTHSKDLGSF